MTSAPTVSCDVAVCPACGAANNCRRAATDLYKGPCWCESVAVSAEAIARLPESVRGAACLCRACIVRLNTEAAADTDAVRNAAPAEPLVHGRDFEVDGNGLFVFTAAYLKRRGWCCGNGCRNCPY
jgi:hypothetical protein